MLTGRVIAYVLMKAPENLLVNICMNGQGKGHKYIQAKAQVAKYMGPICVECWPENVHLQENFLTAKDIKIFCWRCQAQSTLDQYVLTRKMYSFKKTSFLRQRTQKYLKAKAQVAKYIEPICVDHKKCTASTFLQARDTKLFCQRCAKYMGPILNSYSWL